jgi:hypothetical protein
MLIAVGVVRPLSSGDESGFFVARTKRLEPGKRREDERG